MGVSQCSYFAPRHVRPLGRCVRRTLTINGGTPTSNYYVFDGEHWVVEYASDGTIASNVLYGRGMDEVIARGVNGVGWWYFPDRNGNISVITDGINTVRESYRYDAFGLPSVYSGTGAYLGNNSAIGNRFIFTGREWRSLFGFFEYRARAYTIRLIHWGWTLLVTSSRVLATPSPSDKLRK